MSADAAGVIRRLQALAGACNDAELAQALGVSPGAVANWRLRDAVPAARVAKAASQFGVTVDEITTGRGDVAREAPAPYGESTDDGRLSALLAWLRALWAHADEEERAWLVVELRELRARLRARGL